MKERKPPRHMFHRAQRSHALGTAGHGRSWIYGRHAVTAALANPLRTAHRLLIAGKIKPPIALRNPPVEYTNRQELEALVGAGAVHQGIALLVDALPAITCEDICAGAAEDALVVVLDQVTDPQNVGAVMRACAAFDAAALIAQNRNTPPVTGALAKAASGALEHVPLVRVPNLARALNQLKQASFWCLGLESGAAMPLVDAAGNGRTALVLGAEGKGLRRLTRETCDVLTRIPTSDSVNSLNVSNAAAVALYALVHRRQRD